MKILYDTDTETFVRYPRNDDEDVVGLDPRYIPYQVIMEDEPDYNPETHFLSSHDTPNHGEHTLTRGWTVNPLAEPDPGGPGVPARVTPKQLQLWLLTHSNENGNFLEQVNKLINAGPDGIEKDARRIEFDKALYFERTHPLTIQIAFGLGLSDSEIDTAFAEASLL